MLIKYDQKAVEAFYSGLRRSKIDFAVFLPDTLLDGVEQMIVQRSEIAIFQCGREDEGIAMAMGAYLTGQRSVVMMEGSGIGLAALVLARGIVQRERQRFYSSGTTVRWVKFMMCIVRHGWSAKVFSGRWEYLFLFCTTEIRSRP